MQLVLALIAATATVLTGGAVTEIVKRHNLRASIAADLEILGKLEAGPTKTHLSETINDRIVKTTLTPKWPHVIYGTLMWALFMAVNAVMYGFRFERDDEGIMHVVGVRMDLTLFWAAIVALGFLGVYIALSLGGAALGDWMGRRAFRH